MDDFPPKYDPQGIEDKWNDFWSREKLFTADPKSNKKPYTITIPPPNVTGRLTLGHVLNNTLQDILIRYKKLSGFETLWLPGMDHAGIATQVVVEEKLLAQGIKRTDLGREKFIQEVWKWKDEHARVIRTQLRKLGFALDWSRERFTLDDDYAANVTRIFVELYDKKLIYRGEKIVNWCPRCLTTLSNEQVETEEKMDRLYYVKYRVPETGGFLTVATTRPETMLGDTAICVNPDDERYRGLVGKTAVLPIMDRKLPIIADKYVDKEFGTGCLKVTPAHDPFDFELARKHGLQIINIMNPDGTINENGGPFKGQERFTARKNIIEALKRIDGFEKTENYKVPLATCERCHTVVEPKLSKQWFVRMKTLAEPALKAVRDNEVRIYPKRWVNLYNHWLENVIDWPISRQLWWGHRMPVYYCLACFDPEAAEPKGVVVAPAAPSRCPDCGGSAIRQDEDVLDTWFSSWLWPFATLGWPRDTEDLRRFYPTQTLVTGWDIIYLWVARMIMAGYEFTGSKPFSDVFFNTMIRDEKGRKMSKSLGNSPDPIDLIARYGADSLRFGILLITPREQDVLFSEKTLDVGRKFTNKLWNAARLVKLNFPEGRLNPDGKLSVYDRWILAELNRLIAEFESHYRNYELNAVAKKLYDFVWHTFCDWYLEFIKLEPFNRDNIAPYILNRILVLLHPYLPFITEELYQRWPGHRKSIILEDWPGPRTGVDAPADLIRFIGLIDSVRAVRGMFNINPKAALNLTVIADGDLPAFIRENQPLMKKLAGIGAVSFGAIPAGPVATVILPEIHAYVELPGVDIRREKPRLEDEIKALSGRIDDIKHRLSNPQYLAKADEEIKIREAERLETMLRKKEAIEKAIERL
jgi:valyl-tRNA synthetase